MSDLPETEERVGWRGMERSWIWLLALYAFAGVVEVAFWGQMSAFTPLYLPHLGVRQGDVRVWTGVIVAISNLVGLPLLPLWGALADRYARKPIIVRSFLAHLVAGTLMILAGNVWVFLIARSVQSFALGNTGLMLTTLSERAPANRLGFAFAIVNGAQPLGAFLGPLLGGPAVDAWGFRALIAVDMGLLALVATALTFGYRDDYRGTRRGPLLAMAADSVRLIVRSLRLRILFPSLFLLFAGWMLALTYLPLVVTSLYHGPLPGRTVGLVLGLGGLATLVLAPIAGMLADRFGHWQVLFAGASLCIVLWPLPALVHDLVGFTLVWALLSGVASGVLSVSFNVLSGSVGSDVRGRVMSFAFLPINAGLAVGPALGSLVTGSTLFAVFPTAAALTALGVACLVLSYRTAAAPAAGAV